MRRRSITNKCQHCGASSRTRRGIDKFCSTKCAGDARRGNRLPRKQTAEERFWVKVDRRGPDECWPWIGGATSDGYGVFHADRICARAHRWAYRFQKGPIPFGKIVMHSCDNPPCCNGSHLSVGTNADNTADKMRKGRHRPVRGEDHPRAKIDRHKAREIRTSTLSSRQAAKAFGLSPSQIKRIRRAEAWK